MKTTRIKRISPTRQNPERPMTARMIKIQGCNTCKEVLIFLYRDDKGDEFVKLIAWHDTPDGLMMQEGEVDYCKSGIDHIMNLCIIADFSEFSANKFANSFKL